MISQMSFKDIQDQNKTHMQRVGILCRSTALILTCALMICALTSCGKDVTEGKSVREIHKDGTITSTIVADFDETLYNVDELKSMMNEEIDSYNFSHAGEKVTAGEVTCTEGVLTCIMNYATGDDYAEFNTRRFVIEPFEEALSSDLVRISVNSVDDNTQTDLSAIKDTGKLSVFITDETGYVTFPGKVRYISHGVDVIGKKQIDVTEEMDGLVYVIFENK